jgi:hypothetical protein
LELARWALTSVGFVVLAVIGLGPRNEAPARLADAWFTSRAALTLATALVAATVAVRTGVPGLARARRIRAVPWVLCLVWAAVLAGGLASTGTPLRLLSTVSPHVSCVVRIAAIALVPGIWLVRTLRRAAPLDPRWTAGCTGLASAALGALGTQFVCSSDAPAHHLVWHLLPVVLLALATVLAGPHLLPPPGRSLRRGGKEALRA